MYREATSTLCCTRTKLRVKNFLHFLNHPLGLSPQKTGKSIIGRGGLYPVLWWSWLPMRSLRARILNPCNMPSWLLWVPTSFSTGGVFKTPSELATTFLPSIWLARKDWYWVVSASIYRLIWLVFLFCSAPSIILAIFIVDQKLILEILDKYYVVVHQASYNVFPQPLSYCFSPFWTKMNQLRPWNRHYLLRFHLNKIEKR